MYIYYIDMYIYYIDLCTYILYIQFIHTLNPFICARTRSLSLALTQTLSLSQLHTVDTIMEPIDFSLSLSLSVSLSLSPPPPSPSRSLSRSLSRSPPPPPSLSRTLPLPLSPSLPLPLSLRYQPLTPSWNPLTQRFQFNCVGLFLTTWGLRLLEFLYLAPKGTSKIQVMLQQVCRNKNGK